MTSLSISVSEPHRDTLGEFLLLLDTVNGREKFARLIQYTAKVLAYREEIDAKRVEHRLNMYSNIGASMANARKFLRLFKSIQVLRALHVAMSSASTEPLTLVRIANIAAKVFLFSYFTFDHALYAARLGLWQPDEQQQKQLNMLTEGSWCGEIICNIIEHSLVLTYTSDRTHHISMQAASLRALVRNVLDLPIALHFMGLTGQYPHGIFGLLGVITSLMSMYEMWPQVVVAPVKVAVS